MLESMTGNYSQAQGRRRGADLQIRRPQRRAFLRQERDLHAEADVERQRFRHACAPVGLFRSCISLYFFFLFLSVSLILFLSRALFFWLNLFLSLSLSVLFSVFLSHLLSF